MATSAILTDLSYNYYLQNPDWHNKCKDSPYWESWYPRLRVAIFAIALANYVFCLPVLIWFSRRKQATTRTVLSWTAFIPAITATAIWLFIVVVADSYLYCIRISVATYIKSLASIRVFNHLGNMLLLGCVSFQLVPVMWKRVDWDMKVYRMGMISLYTLAALFAVAGITLRDYWEINTVTGAHKIKDRHSATFATFITLYLAGTIVSSSAIVAASWQSLRRQEHTLDNILIKSVVLAISFIGTGIVNMIITMRYEVCLTSTLTKTASAALGVLYLALQAATFWALCWVASAFPDNTADASNERKMAQRASADTQPVMEG